MTITEAVTTWLDDSKAHIIANYNRDNMRASGNFERSLKTNIKVTPGSVVGTLTGSHYSLFVDQGRGKTTTAQKGAVSLRSQIEKWIKDKNIVPNDGMSNQSLAYLITRKIHREGWKPKNSYPNGVISSVINQKEIDKLLLSLGKIAGKQVRSELWEQLG